MAVTCVMLATLWDGVFINMERPAIASLDTAERLMAIAQ